MKIPFLDLSRMDQSLQTDLKNKFANVLEEGRFSFGEEVLTFEKRVGDRLKSPHAISCANGTDALELALRALNIGPGDEVIVPAMTWVSTAEVVLMVGATPVFWDTDAWGLLRSDWEKAISPRTKAIITVHLYGKMVPMADLMAKAKKANISVLEDAAQAFGSFQDGKAAGTWGDVGCLSFYPTKNLGALGEAGMCLTNQKGLADQIRLLSNHGQPQRDVHSLVGRNSRIDTLQAALLNVLLDRFDEFQEKRRMLAEIYWKELAGIGGLSLPPKAKDSNHHLFVIQTEKRDSLKEFLQSNGIGTAIHYPTIVPDIPVYQQKGDFVNARELGQKGLSLPLNPWLEVKEVMEVCGLVKEFFG